MKSRETSLSGGVHPLIDGNEAIAIAGIAAVVLDESPDAFVISLEKTAENCQI
jgi:hypothetical protein